MRWLITAFVYLSWLPVMTCQNFVGRITRFAVPILQPRAPFITPIYFLLVTSRLSDLSVMAFSFMGLMEPFATPALALCDAPFTLHHSFIARMIPRWRAAAMFYAVCNGDNCQSRSGGFLSPTWSYYKATNGHGRGGCCYGLFYCIEVMEDAPLLCCLSCARATYKVIDHFSTQFWVFSL